MLKARPLKHHHASVISSSWDCARGELVPSSIIALYAQHSLTVLQTVQSYVSFGAPIVVTQRSQLGTQRTTHLDRHTLDSGVIELPTQESSNVTEEEG